MWVERTTSSELRQSPVTHSWTAPISNTLRLASAISKAAENLTYLSRQGRRGHERPLSLGLP